MAYNVFFCDFTIYSIVFIKTVLFIILKTDHQLILLKHIISVFLYTVEMKFDTFFVKLQQR